MRLESGRREVYGSVDKATQPLARYVFQVQDGPSATVELPSIADAKCEAVRYAGRLMCDAAESFWDAQDFQMTVTDETGLALFSLHMIGTEAPSILGSA